MAFVYAFVNTTPAGTDQISLGDDSIRDFKSAMLERVNSRFVDVNADPWIIKSPSSGGNTQTLAPTADATYYLGTNALRFQDVNVARNVHGQIQDGGGYALSAKHASFGAVSDAVGTADGAIAAGTNALNSAAATFSIADVGKAITVGGAGVAGATLLTTILGFVNSHNVTLAINAGTTVAAAVVNWGTDNTVALQAWIDALSYSNALTAAKPSGILPAGAFKITGKLRVKNTRVCIRGSGMYNSVIYYQGVAAGCIVYESPVYAQPFISDFTIYGDASSGHGLDFSGPSDFTYNGAIERMLIYAGGNAIYAPRLFSFKIDGVYGESFTTHIFRVLCGPSVSWINTYAGACPLTKVGYRLCGQIRMYSCNGVNSGGYWGVFGSNTALADGFQGDFPGTPNDYPDVELHGCNIEAWTVTGLYLCNLYQKFRMSGGDFSRALPGNYHSAIRSALGHLNGQGGSLVLDGVRALISGGVATGSNVWADQNDALTLMNDNTGFTSVWSAAFGLAYPAQFQKTTGDVFGDKVVWFSGLSARRYTAEVLRYATSALAAGTTDADVTGKTYITTANVAPTTLRSALFLSGVGLPIQDRQRNGFLFIEVTDSFTTFQHALAGAGGFWLQDGRDYVASPGEILSFVWSPLYDGVRGGWIQIGGGRALPSYRGQVLVFAAAMFPSGEFNRWLVPASSGIAFTVNNPAFLKTDRLYTLTIKNTTGGALGAITMGALFRLAGGAFPSPGTGTNSSVTFFYDGATLTEISRATGIPN